MPGMGGGGGGGAAGAPVGGMGGGGGGGGGAPLGDSTSATGSGMGGAGGGGAVGEPTEGDAAGDALSPVADRGRGGAMVPKRMEARWAALLPPGLSLSSSSESSSESLSEPQSSSSGRRREICPVGWGAIEAALASCVIRWKGLVDSAGGGGGAMGAAAVGAVGDASEDCVIILKYGFRLSSLGSSTGGLVTRDGSGMGGAAGAALLSSSVLPT